MASSATPARSSPARGALLALRDDTRQEAAATRQHLVETRAGVEHLYAGAQSEVAGLQNAVMVMGQRIADLETVVQRSAAAAQQAGGNSGGAASAGVSGGDGGNTPHPSAARLPQSMSPAPADPWTAGSGDPWRQGGSGGGWAGPWGRWSGAGGGSSGEAAGTTQDAPGAPAAQAEPAWRQRSWGQPSGGGGDGIQAPGGWRQWPTSSGSWGEDRSGSWG